MVVVMEIFNDYKYIFIHYKVFIAYKNSIIIFQTKYLIKMENTSNVISCYLCLLGT